MANGVYNISEQNLFNGQLDFANDTIIAMLMESSFVFNAANNYVSDIVSQEASGSNYIRQTLTGKSVVRDDVTNKVTFFADNTTWDLITIGSVGACVLFKHVTNDSDSILLGSFGISPAITTRGQQLILRWNGQGIFKISAV